MKKILLPLIVVIGGTGMGAAAAFGTSRVVGPTIPKAAIEAKAEKTGFVPVEHLLAPMVTPDGRLAGYISFNVQLEVGEDQVETVTARLPLLLHAINMRTYRTPMASGPDGLVPHLGVFRRVVLQAAPEAFGAGVVKLVAITRAEPA